MSAVHGGYSTMEDIMGTSVNIMSRLGDTLSSDTTAVCPFIITDKRILHRICFKLASIFIHCVFCDASSLMDTYM